MSDRPETNNNSNETEWVCTNCDWIGSPKQKPEECPYCGELDTMQEIGGDTDN